jgi:hypothetical protein
MPKYRAKVMLSIDLETDTELQEKVTGRVSNKELGIEMASPEIKGDIVLKADMEIITDEFTVELEADDEDDAEEIIREKLCKMDGWKAMMDFESYVDVEPDQVNIDVTVLSVEEIK